MSERKDCCSMSDMKGLLRKKPKYFGPTRACPLVYIRRFHRQTSDMFPLTGWRKARAFGNIAFKKLPYPNIELSVAGKLIILCFYSLLHNIPNCRLVKTWKLRIIHTVWCTVCQMEWDYWKGLWAQKKFLVKRIFYSVYPLSCLQP